MSLRFSLYLDLLRFAAALVVFVDHLASAPFSRQLLPGNLGRYGEIAVSLFFLLSGYVIAHVTATRERHAAAYVSSRLARLYSVMLLALPLTLVCDGLGRALDPALYALPKVLSQPVSWQGYLAALLLVQEYRGLGWAGMAPGSNGPFWSLSFEGCYYLIAGLVLFCRPALWLPLTALLLALAGKTVAALLPLWGLGFVLCRLPSYRLAPLLAWCLLLMAGAALLALPWLYHPGPARFWFPYGRGPFNRDVLQDYLAAGLFALHLLAARTVLDGAVRCWLQRCLRWLGGLTFPLYCMHYPVLALVAASSPWSPASPAHLALQCGATAVLVVLLTPACSALQRRLRALLPS
ncbi:MAG: acyltransferase family protein [Sphingomonadaceae bacterium]